MNTATSFPIQSNPTQAPNVYVIVLNWNGCSDTLSCLESLTRISYRPLHFVVVDNGSTDGSAEAIRYVFPEVHLIETGENLGFAEGNNVGIRFALEQGADFVLLLNNDTEVDPNLIQALVEAARHQPDGGIFGPKIYYYSEPTRIWAAGGSWNKRKKHFEQRGDGELDIGQYATPVTTEFIVGCAMFIRRSVFEKIGLLEPKFFLNYEEIDFCTRANFVGFDNVYVPDAKLWHKISASFGGEDAPLKIYFTFRNRLLWAERNLPVLRIIGIHAAVYAGLRNRFIKPLLSGTPGRSFLKGRIWAFSSACRSPSNQAWVKGIRDYWLRRFGNCSEDVWDLQRKWKVAQGLREHS